MSFELKVHCSKLTRYNYWLLHDVLTGHINCSHHGTGRCAVGRGTELQGGRSRFRFLIESFEFFIDKLVRPPYDCGIDSACNRNEYQEYFRGVQGGWCERLTVLPSSRADCLRIWWLQIPGTLRAYPGLYKDFFTYITLLTSLLASQIVLARFQITIIHKLGFQS